MKRIALITVIILFGATSAFAGSVSVQMLAPAPAGNMSMFRLAPGTLPALPCRLGAFAVGSDNLLYACVDEGGSNVWRMIMPFVKNGNNIYNLGKSASDYFLLGGVSDQLPEFRLSIYGEGGIISTGTFAGSDPVLTTAGAGTRFIWHTNKAAIRAGQITGTQWDDGNIGAHSVAFGLNTQASGAGSFVGGTNNEIQSEQSNSAIVAGTGNSITNAMDPDGNNFIGAGHTNSIAGINNAIPAGNNNTITGNDNWTMGQNNDTIGINGWNLIFGIDNTTSSSTASINVGSSNTIDCSLAGGCGAFGVNNTIQPNVSTGTFVFGIQNTARGPYNFVAGNQNIGDSNGATVFGVQNTINQFGTFWGTVGGGSQNRAASDSLFQGGPTVGGGIGNDAMNDYATVSGGRENWATGEGATIGGGGGYVDIGPVDLGNKASGAYSTISGGQDNDAAGLMAFVGGGLRQDASANYSTIGGGTDNTASGLTSTVGGGNNNTASGQVSTVAGGNLNVSSDTSSTVGGGAQNQATASASTVAGGNLNVASGINSTVVGGSNNTASGVDSIAGGRANTSGGDFSITMGLNNDIDAAASNSIAMGQNFILENTATDTIAFGDGGNVSINNAFLIAKSYTGIGTVNPDTDYRLYVEDGTLGSAYFNGEVYATGNFNPSDERFKENIHPIEDSLDKIASLRGVTFDWKEDPKLNKNRKGTAVGIVAQDVEEVFPEMVRTQKDGYKSVDYSKLIAPLIEAVKELNKKIETLEHENEELRKALFDIQTD